MAKSNKGQGVSRWVEQLIAVTLISLAAAPVAFAADGGAGAEATTSAKASVAKTLTKLKKQVTVLQQQVVELQGRKVPGAVNGPPSGPAGGDLAGTFPNPLIGPNAVGGAQIEANAVGVTKLGNDAVTNLKLANDAVSGAKIADGSVATNDLAADAVTGAKIVDGAVGNADLNQASVTSSTIASGGVAEEDLAGDAVGARALAPTNFWNAIATIPPQSSRNVQASCGNAGEIPISGGGYFTDANDSFVNVWIVSSAPSLFGDAWNVRAANPGLTARSFTAVVHCLPSL